MTTTYQIIIPGLKLKDFSIFSSVFRNQAFGILVYMFLLVQRAQMTIASSLTPQEVQKLDTMRWNARNMLQEISTLDFHLSRSMIESVAFSYENIKGLSQEERNKVLLEEMDSIFSAPRAKVLNPNQIDKNTLAIHRKGLVYSYVGLGQSSAVYSPQDIVKNANPMTLDFKAVYEYAAQFCGLLGYDLESRVKEIFDESIFDEDLPGLELWQKAQKIIDVRIFKSEIDDPDTFTDFADGINIGPTNLLPVELGFSIRRSTPAKEADIIPIDESDPIAKAIQDKTIQLNAEIRSKSKAQRGPRQNARSGNARLQLPPKTLPPESSPKDERSLPPLRPPNKRKKRR